MGLRYVVFRIQFAVRTKLGLLRKKFPTNVTSKSFISLEEWRMQTPPFFFEDKTAIELPKQKSDELKKVVEEMKEGTFTFFNKSKLKLGKENDWITNPDSNYMYDKTKHFSLIQDLSAEAGDIKYVWEKARFSFLYDVIRYDYHFEDDQSTFVFQQIEDFIDKNPINLGPNFKCSQEISLRILNWTFALYYYKNADSLTPALFKKIMNAIYWQLHHVYNNIHFSRIAVRNNHAITETLMLYVSALLFPFITETKKWSTAGKKWFEQEIDYQIYKDGTYLKDSMNYHRVVVQLLTWGLRLAELNKDSFKKEVRQKAEASLQFLEASLDMSKGELPNYGSNDGALFFKFTNDDYRDYRSQLDDLRAVLNGQTCHNTSSHYWYGINSTEHISFEQQTLQSFSKGGYYIINDANSKTFIRCGSYKDRPAQSDNLHVDIWANGINYLRDSGTYKYNTSKELTNYFMGCEGHNTVSVDGQDQMLKGSRFIWFNWIKKSTAELTRKDDAFFFKGAINGFKNVGNNIKHSRELTKKKNKLEWHIIDTLENVNGKEIVQYWHLDKLYAGQVSIETKDGSGTLIEPVIEEKWYSSYYGIKEKSLRFAFKSTSNQLFTTIKIKN